MKQPKPKSKSLPKLKKELDTVFSKYIRARDGNKCVICGSTNNVQCGHLIRRGKGVLRWDHRNCNAQCAKCNYKHEYYPEPYTNWWLKKYDATEYDLMVSLCNIEFKYNRTEIEEKIKYYNTILKTMDI